jgi:hypothetical protein
MKKRKNTNRLPGKLADKHVDQLAELIVSINRTAHGSTGSARRTAYRMKSELLSAAITILEDQVDFDYQFDDGRGEALVLVHLKGTRTRAFHAPFEQLQRPAQVRVINRCGTPTRFERQFQLQA